MGLQKAYLGRLTILNAATTSNILAARELAFARGLVFKNPAAFTGVVTLQVAPREDSPTSDFAPMTPTVTLTAATQQPVSLPAGFGEAIRAVSGSAEGADRFIDVWASLELSD